MPGTSSIGGLVSGLDTASIINALIAVSKKRIDVVAANQTEKSDKLAAFQSFNTQLLDFQSKAEKLKTSDTFNVFKTSASTDSATFKSSDLVSIATTTNANPGTHKIEFTSGAQLAQARQISSQSYNDYTTALTLSGEFLINGKVIKVTATDSLEDIAVNINNANSGSNATRVTASIIAVSDTDNRLILTSDDTGANKFNILAASSTDLLASFGFTSGDTIKNATSDGATSDAFSNSQTAVGSLLGLTNPQNNTVTIGGQSVSIDLSTESLTTIAANINTALTGASSGTATVVSKTTDGVTTYRIDINGTTSFTDSNNILETLGILKGTNSNVNEVHTGSAVNTTDGSTAITEINTFDQLFGAGLGGVEDQGDTITISGTKNDGSAITTTSFNIYSGGYKQISQLLTQIETLYGGASVVDAYISNGSDGNTAGQIVIKDLAAGDSQLSLTLVANNEGAGSTLDFGTVSATTKGYSMENTAGQDAKVKIDGVAVTRSSNSIDDVISGVTVDVSRVESGSTVNFTVSRDTDSIKSSVNNFVSSYNTIIEFINKEFKFNEDANSAGILAGETTLSSIKSSIQSIITGSISLLPTGSNAISLIGITSDSDGKLSLKDSAFLTKLNSDFNAVKRMFVAEGTATNSEITYIGHTKKTAAGEYTVTINTAATKASETGEIALTGGIGAGIQKTIRITDTVSGRVATIALDGDTTTGNSIDNIVSAINSELDTETTETLVGSVANTAISTGLAITSSTKFNNITGAGLSNNDIISYTGTTRQGLSVSGSYQISDVTTNTVQNLLSAIEADYDNAVSATIDSSGKIVLTDNTVGDSLLTLDITEPASLDFGTVTTTNTGGVVGRYAMEITASKDANDQLVITSNNYGSADGFTISQVTGTDAATGNEVITGSTSNTLASDGVTKIAAGTTFGAINTTGVPGNDITNGAVISYSGRNNGGTSKSGSYTIADKNTNTVQDMLTQIETDFGLTGGSLTVSNGQIMVTDDTAGVSRLGIAFTFDANAGGLSFGTFASQYTGIANGVNAGVDVAGTINGEAATGTGQLLKGNKPGTGATSSVEGLAIKVTSTNESLTGSVANTAGASAITSATLFSAIDGAAVVDNDTITISGTKHDGTAVSYTYTITAANQVNDLLTSIETNFGLSGTAATINSDGKIAINDTFTGSSQLKINLTENNEGAGSLDFGTITPGSKDTIKLTMGVAESMYNKLTTMTDPIDGVITIRTDGLEATIDGLQGTIDGMQNRLVMETLQLNNKFVQLELNLSKLQSVSSFLSQQLGSLANFINK